MGKSENADLYINLPSKYLDTPLTTKEKLELCEELNFKNANGRLIKWPTLKDMLQKQGYRIEDTKIIIDDKRPRVSIITI